MGMQRDHPLPEREGWRRYTCRVRRVLCVLLLSITTVVMLSDTFRCADGCTENLASAASAVSACPLCARGIAPPPTVVAAPVTASLVVAVPEHEFALVTTSPQKIDHPPRPA